jgi:hypothetical protein
MVVEWTVLVFVGIAVAILLFLALRTVALWYFRVNDVVALLEQLVTASGATPATHRSAADEAATASAYPVSQRRVVVCRGCGSFKEVGGYCPECRSGWAGARVKDALWKSITDAAAKDAVELPVFISAHAACQKCGSLIEKGQPCTSCGTVAERPKGGKT